MQTDNRFLDDLAKLASSAVGTMHGVKGELEAAFRQKMDAWLAGMDLVQREEFEAVKAMAEAARLENEALAKRLAVLEKAAGPAKPARTATTRTSSVRAKATAAAKSAKKPATKKPTARKAVTPKTAASKSATSKNE